jgi:MazG family protein
LPVKDDRGPDKILEKQMVGLSAPLFQPNLRSTVKKLFEEFLQWRQTIMGVDAVIGLIETLRGKNGCPWDRKQTPRTIVTYLLEEVYELIDAVESGSHADVCEELGDVLFHILFLVSLYREAGNFDIQDVCDLNLEKMTRRHPHVFGDDRVDSADEVRARWQKIKMKEKPHAPVASILDSVPSNLPALMRAFRISDRAAKTGFDWDDITGVMQKVEEEWAELKTALSRQDGTEQQQNHLALEFGDVLFTLVNVARFARIHPEFSLRDSTKKFENRFKYMEKLVKENGKDIESASREKMDALWETAKSKIG